MTKKIIILKIFYEYLYVYIKQLIDKIEWLGKDILIILHYISN